MARVAMVVSTVGFHWEELFGAYFAFKKAGFTIELYTVDGTPAKPDPMSLKPTGPGALMGLGMPRRIAPDTARGQELTCALDGVRPLSALDADAVDTLYLPGGHGCLFDVNANGTLHAIVKRLYTRGCVLSAVCHATSTFSFVEANGRPIVAGHAMTGFPHALDRTLIPLGLVRKEFLPLPIVNDEALRRAGAKLTPFDAMKAYLNPRYMRVSSPFITGVGPKSAARVARAVVRAVRAQKAPHAHAQAAAAA